MSVFDSFLEIAGNLGFLVGDNDRRRDRARKERRSWGTEREGFAVSLAASSVDLKPDQTLRIEVALRNAGAVEIELSVSAWLCFFTLEMKGPEGTPVELTLFGQTQFEAARRAPKRKVSLKPGELIEADIPVSALYSLKKKGLYRIRGKSEVSSAFSNELEIRI